MDFRLNDEQLQLAATVGSAALDPRTLERRRVLVDGDEFVDSALWESAAQIGLFGIMVAERYGGAGMGLMETAIVSEQLGRGAAAIPFESHVLATMAIEGSADEHIKDLWLPRLIAGEMIATIACAEANSWNPGDWTTSSANGIRGQKRSVVAAPVADVIVVAAKDGLHLVVTADGDLEWYPRDALDRTRRHVDVNFESTAATSLIGSDVDRIIDAALVLQAADAFGAATELIAQTVEYSKNRMQFGRPIAGFQAVKHQVADMATAVAMSRGLWWYAAHAFDSIPADRRRAAALAKAHVTDRAWTSGRAAIEVQGGIAFTWEADAHLYYKRIQTDRQMFGTPTDHLRRFADLEGW